MRATPDILTHITNAVHLDEKHRGNPYQYLLDRWETRGERLLDAAVINTQGDLTRDDLELLALAWDLQDAWEGPKSAILGLLEPIQALYELGVPIAQIRAISVRLAPIQEVAGSNSLYDIMFDRLCQELNDLRAEHERELDRLDELDREDDRRP